MNKRPRNGGGRRRRRKPRTETSASAEPVTIAARRPNSPLLSKPARRSVAASAAPRAAAVVVELEEDESLLRPQRKEPARREARIIKLAPREVDASELERLRMLDRLVISEGRGAITRLADAYLEAGFEFPSEQRIQLQLLEHFDEAHARAAMGALEKLYEDEDPIKKPVLEQRLRRLEDHADEESTRDTAAKLRRAIR